MPSHSKSAAVSVLRGSITNTRPPRLTTAFMCSRIRGMVTPEPWDTTGLAPMTTNKSVRGMSGTGIVAEFP
ncbi:Uncharacterised protein [Mycobacteroides abscessus subsp. abscessus]|nr:Uncharacterised protein [Mycobacteroides abscessus subsp. abscessus]SIA33485.1 Uncharacterised protein [Mycobacteroides abscessus subsp. abscessus]